MKKIFPLRQPAVPTKSENGVDISLLDFMGIEEFLSILKAKTENNNQALWKASCALAGQLKGSRALLSLGSYLSSNEGASHVLDRLTDTAFFILNAEHIFLFQLDGDGSNLVVTHSHHEAALGLKLAVHAIVSGKFMYIEIRIIIIYADSLIRNVIFILLTFLCLFFVIDADDAAMRAKTTNITDVQRDPKYITALDAKTGSRTRTLISIPILIDGIVRGAIVATNKLSSDVTTPNDRSPVVFGPNDEVLLGFIAANAGLAIKHSILTQNNFSNGFMGSPTSVSAVSRKTHHSESSKALRSLVDQARNDMDADKVSIFSYNDFTKRLECMVSQDIEGLSIPSDRGIAGNAFRMGRVINVQETDEDDRHFTDIDQRVGYKTKTLLCAPILDDSGNPIGVMQALNKKKNGTFSHQDEGVISGFCPQVYALLREQDELRTKGDGGNQTALMAKFVASIMSTKTMEELSQEVRRTVMSAVQCDYVGVYTYAPGDGASEDHLIYHSGSEEQADRVIPLRDVPQEVMDSIRSRTATEAAFGAPTPNGGRSVGVAEREFLPGCPARQALILPVGMNQIAGESSASVLVVTRTRHSSAPFGGAAREVLEGFATVLGSLIEHVSMREKQSEAIANLEQNFQLANSTLSALQDYIILLSSSGYIQAQNRDLAVLVSGDFDGGEGDEDPDQPQHFSTWLKPSNCPELYADINEALKTNQFCSKMAVRLVSPEFPSGVFVDYQLLPFDYEAIASEEYVNSLVMVLRVRKDMMSSPRPSGGGRPSFSKQKSRVMGGQSWDLTSAQGAAGAIEVATGMINNVGSKYQLKPDVHRQINEINASLQRLIKSLEPEVDLHEPVYPLVNLDLPEPDGLLTWEFNALEVTNRAVLVNIMGRLFETLFPNMAELDIDSNMLALYIQEVSDKYHDRPFHNLHHATTVTHFSFMLIHATNAAQHLTKHHLFSVLLAAIVHDVDHPGNTNMFEINSQSELALLYNDQSVLENHHCSTAFRMMRKPSTNLFARIPKQTATDMRKTIVSCVMATDMSVHFNLVEDTKKWAAGGDVSFTEANEQIFLCKLLVHAADLSNPVRPFHITKMWAKKISEEFNVQVAREQELGMPVLGFMMTPDDKALCKNETGFASFVVAPMWRSLAVLFPGLQPLIQQLDANLQTWKSLLEQILKEEEAGREAGKS
jgi:GAF domain-containing protein